MLEFFKKFVEEPCDHHWEVIDTKVMQPPIEIAALARKTSKGKVDIASRTDEDLLQSCCVKMICVVKCRGVCGGLKKYVVTNIGTDRGGVAKSTRTCKHDWHVLETSILPSPIEVLEKLGRYPTTKDPEQQRILATNKYVCVVACKAGCGDVKILTETNRE